MEKKTKDLEAILDLMYEWCKEYEEPYISMGVLNQQDRVSGMTYGNTSDTDIDIYKVYEEREE